MAPVLKLSVGALMASCCYASAGTQGATGRLQGRAMWGFMAPPQTGIRSTSVRPSSGVSVKSQTPVLSKNRHERSKGLVVRRVDVPSVMADDVYAPMFAQALLLSVSGILGAVALAAIIHFRGEDLQRLLVEEAYQETTALKAKLGATQDSDDGAMMIGFKDTPSAPTPMATPVAEAVSPKAKEAKEEEVEVVLRPKEKELVSAGGAGSRAADLGDDYDD